MFRSTENALIFSVALSIILSMAIYHVYFNRHEPDFYATSGVTEPVPLTPMNEPNSTPYPLLANDPTIDANNKAVLQ